MTLLEVLKQTDTDQFLKTMHKELTDHISRKHWKVVPRANVPTHNICLPTVWFMKRKRKPIGKIKNGKHVYVLVGIAPSGLSTIGTLTSPSSPGKLFI